MMRAAEEHARGVGLAWVVLHAQMTAKGFYLKNGYAEEGEPFLEDDIMHVRMRKQL